ncbi:MAG: sensor histidine kinase [Bdellovibrio sp.]
MIQLGRLQGLLFAYLFTLFANLFVGMLQYKKTNNRLHLNMVGIWASTILIIFAYLLTGRIGVRISGIIAAPFVFLNFLLYSQFFSEVRKVKFPKNISLRVFAVGYFSSSALYFLDVPFAYFALPTLISAVFPFCFVSYFVLKNKTSPFTNPQIIFFTNQIVFTALNLTWNPEFFSTGIIFIGFLLSLASGQVNAVIVPIVGNDYIFKEKTETLENIISKRVDELTLARRQLWEANKNATMGRLAGGLAHEFNSSLSLINIQTDLIEKKMKLKNMEDALIRESVLGIQQQIDKLGHITASLRKIAKDEGGVERSVFDIKSVLEETLTLLHDRFKKLGIQLKVNEEDEPILVKISESDISNVILQLLNNAIEAVDRLPEKYITISVKSDPKTVFVEIADSGTLTDEAAEKIMEPFYTGKPVGRGVGLGLSVSKSIIEAHGGHLYLDRSVKNTQFVFTLPRAKEQSEKMDLDLVL